ncbi:MAG: hypothetical protein CL908_03910 [Deltaproteobacteria bacterium]|nr:hypothetical protein [Deltaproteobacteria bacterium]
MVNPEQIKMGEEERLWWECVRRRGAMWYVVNKGALFLLLYPAIGVGMIGWPWQSTLLVEGWLIGLVCGGFVWMRKELRYRFTLDEEGLALPDGRDE